MRLFSSDQEGTRNIDFSKIKRGLQYIASKVYFTSPKTAADLIKFFKNPEVFNNFGMTLHEEEERTPFFKVCHNESNFSYCIFSSNKTVELINKYIPNVNNRTILIDGTFAVIPIGCFKQLIMMHIQYSEKVSSLSYSNYKLIFAKFSKTSKIFCKRRIIFFKIFLMRLLQKIFLITFR